MSMSCSTKFHFLAVTPMKIVEEEEVDEQGDDSVTEPPAVVTGKHKAVKEMSIGITNTLLPL